MTSVFLDYETVSNRDLDLKPLREALPDLTLYDQSTVAQIAGRIENAEVVLLNKAGLDRALLSSARHLKLIAVAATGTDNIDTRAAHELGIAVCNIRSYCTRSVVQHVWGAILALTHHLREYERLVRDGTWSKAGQFTLLAFPIRELAGKTLGIVGFGELGRGVAQVGEAFGMRIAIAIRPGGSPAPGRLELDELLAESDIVSLHCPLTDQTRGLIGDRELRLMKRGGLLINTARGALIDSAALAMALQQRRIGGAAIDVLPQEPPVNGDALLDEDLPNLLITPHIAWAARESRQRCLEEMAANVADFQRGGRRGRVV